MGVFGNGEYPEMAIFAWEDDGFGKAKPCIFCMNNHRSQPENVQGPGLWLATAVGRKVAQGSLRQHKRLRSVETW